jgi:uncharacterized BrkB/YihY/UPF0761 family membrane protein
VPGAILVSAGLQVLQLVTVLYVTPRLDSATAAYGALGVALVLLLWLYMLGRLVIASAMLNATLWERRSSAAPDATALIGEQALAAVGREAINDEDVDGEDR